MFSIFFFSFVHFVAQMFFVSSFVYLKIDLS